MRIVLEVQGAEITISAKEAVGGATGGRPDGAAPPPDVLAQAQATGAIDGGPAPQQPAGAPETAVAPRASMDASPVPPMAEGVGQAAPGAGGGSGDQDAGAAPAFDGSPTTTAAQGGQGAQGDQGTQGRQGSDQDAGPAPEQS